MSRGLGDVYKRQEDILGKNNEYAAANRRWFSEHGVLALNLVSSPGSGKTTLLARTIDDLKAEIKLSVIEGDQQTANDAERIRATGVKALQINTGKGCHLDGHMVGHALENLQPEDQSVLFIENVGNLVCPAAFDLGEAHKVAILSVTEGEDKPVKYPAIFARAEVAVVTKSDLLPYVPFDLESVKEQIVSLNPQGSIVVVSSLKGDGVDQWLDLLRERLTAKRRQQG